MLGSQVPEKQGAKHLSWERETPASKCACPPVSSPATTSQLYEHSSKPFFEGEGNYSES